MGNDKGLKLFCLMLVGGFVTVGYISDVSKKYVSGTVVYKQYDSKIKTFNITLNDNIKYETDKDTYIHSRYGEETIITYYKLNSVQQIVFIIALLSLIFCWVPILYFED